MKNIIIYIDYHSVFACVAVVYILFIYFKIAAVAIMFMIFKIIIALIII